MKKKFLIMIAVITAVISCLWFFLKPAAKDPTLVTLYGNVDIRQFDIGFQVPGQITWTLPVCGPFKNDWPVIYPAV